MSQSVRIIMDGDGALKDWEGRKTYHVTDGIRALRLVAGMGSGAPSIAFAASLPDGKKLILEMSQAMLVAIARACEGRSQYEAEQAKGPRA